MIELAHLKDSFTAKDVPPFPCPHCASSLMMLPKGLTYSRNGHSIRLLEEAGYDPDHDFGVFVLRIECSNGTCREPVSCIGTYCCSEGEGPSGEPTVERSLDPLFFCPTILIFRLPVDVPSEIASPLLQSFALFWSNPNAAANSLRAAVEAMMDFRRVNKTIINQNRKRITLSLHARIEEFRKLNHDMGQKLMAIKWLGNSGSHLSGISKKDLCNGYKLVEYVMEEMFENRRQKLDRLAKRILRRKGRA